MKTITYSSILLFLLCSNLAFAQSSGVVIAASIESRDIAYFNESNSIDSHNLNIGFDKCFGGNLVLYTGFRYTKSNGKHTCSQCGVSVHWSEKLLQIAPHHLNPIITTKNLWRK